MNVSKENEVREMYDPKAESYSAMMDTDIALPLYTERLSKLSESIADTHGPLIDTSCGPGHMLSLYRERFDKKRPLVGVDLSPRMVALASARLGSDVDIRVGDMRRLEFVKDGSAAGAISFFALHHLAPEEVRSALQEWRRIIVSGGQLLIATWEGRGLIDYGTHSNLVALRYTKKEITAWVESAGFAVSRCLVEPVEGMEMDAVYLEATRH
ncbi:methyltransferase domain-containing protein [bacterium]|jgi:ubiquinone/menaquinone biosynthesis C-methylase UbiE|nr:methyltransferase domain-containing protein [Verrucomicrobiota bacterium]MDA7632745.1 methyltransferase domain-containing protein [bacterium]MDA7645655.1 methyltransferase domain-containing protein [bacterium]